MNDALVPTDPCRCMFKWMGLNLTIEMTGHSFLGHGAGYMNGLWRWGAWWLMPHEEEPGNLRRKTRENHPCRKCERLEDPWVVALFLNQATSYPLYHLIPVWKELTPLLIQPKMVLFITRWRFYHQWPTMLLDETLALSSRELLEKMQSVLFVYCGQRQYTI